MWAYLLDGKGAGTRLEPWSRLAGDYVDDTPLGGDTAQESADEQANNDPNVVTPDTSSVWVHLDFSHPRSVEWLNSRKGADNSQGTKSLVVQRLTQATTAGANDSRTIVNAEGANGVVRTVTLILQCLTVCPESNELNPTTLRMRLAPRSLLTTRGQRLFLSQVPWLHEDLVNGRGAKTPGHLFSKIIEVLVERSVPAVDALGEEMYSLREDLQEAKKRGHASVHHELLEGLHKNLAPTRQRLIRAQRYLLPQLDAMEALMRRSEAAGVSSSRKSLKSTCLSWAYLRRLIALLSFWALSAIDCAIGAHCLSS